MISAVVAKGAKSAHASRNPWARRARPSSARARARPMHFAACGRGGGHHQAAYAAAFASSRQRSESSCIWR